MSYADPDAHYIIDMMTIRMPYVAHRLSLPMAGWPIVTPNSPIWARRVAEQLGRQFHRETRFDGIPYLAEDPDGDVVLLPSQSYLIGRADLIAGAVGISAYDPEPHITWAYVHPYQRGRGLIDSEWPLILAKYPSITLHRDPANTEAGNAMLDRLEAKTAKYHAESPELS